MRKVVFTFAVCVCMVILSHAQKCEVVRADKLGIMYPATQINLFDEYSLDLSKMNFLEPPVKNLSADPAYRAYIAPSDSTIMVFVAEDLVSFFKICSTEKECDSLDRALLIENVILDEFSRLQPAGVFQGSAVEADSLIHHIVQKMKDKFGISLAEGDLPNDGTVPSYLSFSSLSYNPFTLTRDEDKVSRVIPVADFCTYYRNKTDIQFCDLIDTVRQCGADFRQDNPTSLKSVRRGVSPEAKYRAFDMNGSFIRSGTWHENSADKFRTPAIIRFENGAAVPLYNKKQ